MKKDHKSTVISSILTVLFFTGLILTALEIDLYRKTLISWPAITAIWLLVGALMTPVTSKVLEKYYGTTQLFWQVVYNTGAFGGIVIYSFMALNFYSSPGNEKMLTSKIVKSGSLAKGRHGCSHPYVIVEIIDRTKQVVLPCDFEIGDSNFAKLTIRKGLFGFDIIDKTELLKK